MTSQIDPRAVAKCRIRLNAAKAALDDLDKCNEYDRFSALWYNFLVAAKGVYTVLEQGTKVSAQGRQWFGAVSKTRRSDPLLQYLFQARDDDEHGLNPVIAHDKTTSIASLNAQGFTNKIAVKAFYNTEQAEDASIDLTAINGVPLGPEEKFPCARLIRVHGRDRKPYDPPDRHLGNPVITDMPVPVGRLALVYLESVVEEAATRA